MLLLLRTGFGMVLQQQQVQFWSLAYEGNYYPATVPSNSLLDLMNHSLIKNYYLDDNYLNLSSKLQHLTFTYNTTLTLSPLRSPSEVRVLRFEGLDTYFALKVNGQPLTPKHFNMFIRHEFDITNLTGNVPVEITFSPSRDIDRDLDQKEVALAYSYGHTRKSSYQHGWDWAPSAVSVGIWKNVYIISYSSRLTDVSVKTYEVSKTAAKIKVVVQKEGNADSFVFSYLSESKIVQFNNSANTAELMLFIENPKFWWPHTHGIPHLYHFKVELLVSKEVVDSRTVKHGIRTVKLDQQNGDFTFVVNGHKIYSKGANYVPPDMFMPRLSNPAFRERNPQLSAASYKDIVATIKDSNYNMIRIWGGGQYEADEFYDLLSEQGVMVFHDFMFSDSNYPTYDSFLKSVEEEVKQVLMRLRNQPCIVHWSGNNEIQEGLQSWGFSSGPKKDYDLLFKKTIPDLVAAYWPNISYTHSSGLYGVFNIDKGDVHYWDVWARMADFQNYQRTAGKFNSEFGTQSPPAFSFIQQFVSNESNRRWGSEAFMAHEKHANRDGVLTYSDRTEGVLLNKEKDLLKRQVYMGQLSQAYGVGLGIMAQRIARNHSWGTLYWQFNDAWPAISWSSMDYQGNWKALQYRAKELYESILVAFRVVRDSQTKITKFDFVVVNDLFQSVTGSARLVVVNCKGEAVFQRTFNNVTAKQNEVVQVSTLDLAKQNIKVCTIFGYFTQTTTGNIYRNSFGDRRNFIKPDELTGKLKAKVMGSKLYLSTDGLLLQLYITTKSKELRLSKNFIDIWQGEQHEIAVVNGDLSKLKGELQFFSFADVKKGDSLVVEWA